MATPNRYRLVDYIAGRIVQSRELLLMQQIDNGLNGSFQKVSWNLDAIYRDGATFNITATATGTNVSLTATNSSYPLMVFVNGRWEGFLSGEITTTSLPSGGNIYLNWVLRQVTSSEDTTLVDATTSAPAADMGELDLTISSTDTSGVSLSGSQLAKNTSPIILYTYALVSGSLVLTPIDNVVSYAYGTENCSGLVSLSTNTADGVACSTDDPRLTNTRSPSSATVINASVRTPVSPGGTNSDGTTIYNFASDAGGISAAKIVYLGGTQLVSDAITWIKSQIGTINTKLNAHINVALGSAATHPMPTPAQVGAAPISHVGMPLGLSASHPATVSSNTTGFTVTRSSSVAYAGGNSAGFAIIQDGSTELNGMLHNGDFYSVLGAGISASPGGTNPNSGALTTGALSLFSTAVKVLQQHVNQTSGTNPHGITASELGAATTGYVNTQIADVLAEAESYANSIATTLTLSTTTVTTNGGKAGFYLVIQFSPNGLNTPQGVISLAIGMGQALNGDIIPVPSGFTDTNQIVCPGAPIVIRAGGAPGDNLEDFGFTAANNGSGWKISGDYTSGGSYHTPSSMCVNWTSIAWKIAG